MDDKSDKPAAPRVSRYDVGTLSSPVMLENGWLRCDGYLTRTGIFTYRRADGSAHRELRLPEEVFKADSLGTFKMVPLTDDHPPVALDSANTRNYAAGSVGEDVRPAGDFVRASMLVTDGNLIRKMIGGKAELSCGYTCEVEDAPGEWNGMKYDSVQRNIKGNHLAVVMEGRAGRSVRVKMDTSDAVMVTYENPQESTLTKVKFDEIEYEVSDSAAQAIAKASEKFASELQTVKSELSTLQASGKSELATVQAKADSLAEDLKKAQDALAVASDPARIAEAVKARVELETSARKILGAEAKFDGKDADAIKIEAVKKAYPDFSAEGKSADYVQARFDLAVEKASQVVPATHTDSNIEAAGSPDQARNKHIQHLQNLWKSPIQG